MYKNPYELFNVDPNISPEELKKILLQYKSDYMELQKKYASYYKALLKDRNFKASGKILGVSQTDDLLARRYMLGMDLDRTLLSKEELKYFFKDISSKEEIEEKNVSPNAREEILKRYELFATANWEISALKGRIERAIQCYRDNPKNYAPMMDVLLCLRLNEIKCDIARDLAFRLSDSGIICSEDEFKEAFQKSTYYQVATKAYEQINTQAKREDLIPEVYVMKRMSSTDDLKIVSDETVKELVDRNDEFLKEFLNNLETKFLSRSISEKEQIPENQYKDYGWGIALRPTQYLLKDEPVSNPIFKGKMTIENLGAFTEKSLYRKKRELRTYDVKLRKRAQVKKGFLPKLTRTPQPSDDDDKYETQTIYDYYYQYESACNLMDNILRVTKTDLEGRTTTSIIFSPISYIGERGSERAEFLKNVYFSDYALSIAEKNGGYAGRLVKDANGFYISNRFNQGEIGSAVLFQAGQQGSIVDCRKPDEQKIYEKANKDDFLKLLNQTERERSIDE